MIANLKHNEMKKSLSEQLTIKALAVLMGVKMQTTGTHTLLVGT